MDLIVQVCSCPKQWAAAVVLMLFTQAGLADVLQLGDKALSQLASECRGWVPAQAIALNPDGTAVEPTYM